MAAYRAKQEASARARHASDWKGARHCGRRMDLHEISALEAKTVSGGVPDRGNEGVLGMRHSGRTRPQEAAVQRRSAAHISVVPTPHTPLPGASQDLTPRQPVRGEEEGSPFGYPLVRRGDRTGVRPHGTHAQGEGHGEEVGGAAARRRRCARGHSRSRAPLRTTASRATRPPTPTRGPSAGSALLFASREWHRPEPAERWSRAEHGQSAIAGSCAAGPRSVHCVLVNELPVYGFAHLGCPAARRYPSSRAPS